MASLTRQTLFMLQRGILLARQNPCCRSASTTSAVRSTPALVASHAGPSRVIRSTRRSASNVVSPRRWASSISPASATDPREKEVNDLLLKGIECMAASDLEGARNAYQRSIEIKETPAALYNLALALYQLGQLPECIVAFERSLELQPSSDAHTNVASAYVLSTPPNAAKAIEHLQKALELAPSDGEINFNMGVIFEATDKLEDALREYQRAQELGIERATQCIRNVGGKIFERKRQAGGSSTA